MLFAIKITDQIGRHEVPLPINHNHYNFRESKSILSVNYPLLVKISVAETLSNVTILSILENPQFCKVKVVVAIVIVINSVIGGFS